MVIANRTVERADSIIEIIANDRLQTASIPLTDSSEELFDAARKSDLIINCTTIGMRYGPEELSTPLRAEHIPKRALVCDLVYNPIETPLLRQATLSGAPTLGGVDMLVYQGAQSFEMWTGIEAPLDIMRKAARDALGS